MNDERPIEKLLRRAAQKRRDESPAPLALHPAHRRALQAEVARQFPPAPASSAPARPTFLQVFWQRWAYAVAIFIVLAAAAIFLRPTDQKFPADTTLALFSATNEIALGADTTWAGAAEATAHPEPAVLSGGGNFITPQPAGSTVPASGHVGSLRVADKPPTGWKGQSAGSGQDLSVAQTPAPQVSASAVARSDTFFALNQPESEAALAKSVPAPAVGAAPSRRASETSRASEGEFLRQQNRLSDATEANRASALVAPKPKADVLVASRARPEATATPPATQTPNLNSFASDAVVVAPRPAAQALLRAEMEAPRRAWSNAQAFANLGYNRVAPTVRATAPSAPPAGVMEQFKIEQAGSHVRVVDGDGSVYHGYLDPGNIVYQQVVAREQPQSNSRLGVPAQRPAKLESSAPAPPARTDLFLFRVAGTNRTFNQPVVFYWNYVPTNPAVAANQFTPQQVLQNSVTEPAANAGLVEQFPQLQQNSLLNGRLEFGPRRQIEINAVPTER